MEYVCHRYTYIIAFLVHTILLCIHINADNVHKILQDEIGDVFAKILECAGVYKRDEAGKAAFLKFVDYVNAQ